MVAITTVGTWHARTANFWADFEQCVIDRAINKQTSSKTIVYLCQGWKTALRTLVITFDTAHCSDKNTVCFKDLTFLFITQHNALGKRGIQQEKWTHARIPQPSLEETYGKSICLECCVVWKRNVDSTKSRYMTTWGIWNMALEAYGENTMDWAQTKGRDTADGWNRKRNNGHR